MKRNSPTTTNRLGPGEYVPDPTEGVQRIEDLPRPKRLVMQRNFHHAPCPQCGRPATRKRTFQRHLHDLGDVFTGRPQEITLTYSQHYCPHCECYFNTDMRDVAPLGSHYMHRVIQLGVRLVVEDGLPYRVASWHLWRDHRVFVPFATLQNWVEAGEKSPDHTRRLSGLGAE
jgi:transposase